MTAFQKIQSLKNKEPVRYLIAGGSAFVVDYGALVVAYYAIRLSLGLSTTLGYFAGFLISFFANRYWVFSKSGTTRKPIKQVVEYTILVIFNYFFTLIAIQKLDMVGIKPSVGKILVMVLIVVWNYLIFQKLIFSDKKQNMQRNDTHV